MKHLKILLLILITWPSFGQVNVHIPNGGSTNKAATQEWVKDYFNSWLLRVDPDNPSTDPPVIIDPSIPECVTSLTVTSIYAIEKTSLRSTITSSGVTKVNWEILSNGQIVKSGSVLNFVSPINISWIGNLTPNQTYTLKVDAVNCTSTASRTFVVPMDVPVPVPCTSSPTITGIDAKTQTSLTFGFSGLNVSDLVWSIKVNGAVLRTSSLQPGALTTITVTFATIPYGYYELELRGLGCTGNTIPVSFSVLEPQQPVASSRGFYYNTTGGGFSLTEADGIDNETKARLNAFLNMSYQGVSFKAIQGLRINIKWWQYEPSEGVYNDSKLLDLLRYCMSKGIKLSVCYVPWRHSGDGVIPVSDQATLQNGKIWYMEGAIQDITTFKSYIPSMWSTIGRQKFARSAKHMAQVLHQYPAYSDYISVALSPTEEFQMVYEESTRITTGYSQADKTQWAIYSGGQSPPYPDMNRLPAAMYEQAGTIVGKLWYEFHTDGLAGFFAAARDGIKEGGLRACGYYGGAGAPSPDTYSARLNKLFAGADLVYSTEGDAPGHWAKLMTADLTAGTFPYAKSAIEFDHPDLGALQNNSLDYDKDLSPQVLLDYSRGFFNRGGEIVHFSMSLSPRVIPQLAPAMFVLWRDYIQSSDGMQSVSQGSPINYTITDLAAFQNYRNLWQQQGGSITKQIKIVLN